MFVGLDLSRKRVDVVGLGGGGDVCWLDAVAPDRDGLAALVDRCPAGPAEVVAAVESMTGARFVHDELERRGWDVRIADARRAKGIAPLACKTDRVDARVLAELCRRELVPEVWLPDPLVREERELARFRVQLVKQRTQLKNRIHATLASHGLACPVSDLFGRNGRALLAAMPLLEPWRGDVEASLRLVDQLDREVHALERELRRRGADHRYVPLLLTCPGIGWVLAFTIAAEIGDIDRFANAGKLVAYSRLAPRVHQSGEHDRRGPLTKNGPRYLSWAFVEAAQHAHRHPAYSTLYNSTKARWGKQRGSQVATVAVARKLVIAVWHMLTREQPFAPPSATQGLAPSSAQV